MVSQGQSLPQPHTYLPTRGKVSSLPFTRSTAVSPSTLTTFDFTKGTPQEHFPGCLDKVLQGHDGPQPHA